MKFVVNTTYNSAGTVVLRGIIKRLEANGDRVAVNDWKQYNNYDIAIFMAPDSKIREAKAIDDKIKCGLFDPKVSKAWQIEEAKAADFLIVSSIEQRDFFLKYNESIYIYYMFPNIPEVKKEHVDKQKIVIGYHGNKQHLDAMTDVSWALDRLSKEYDIEFRAIYNVKKLGKWRLNVPQNCSVRHIQWSEKTLVADLSQCDIGIVPSVMPSPKLFTRSLRSIFYNPEGYNRNDYVYRFKMSNNPGRIYVFSQLHIPVIADFTPSACQFIKDGQSGMLAGTREGWERNMKLLIREISLRRILSTNLIDDINKNYSQDINFSNFIEFIKKDE